MTVSRRLARAAGQLLLALVNATLVLVILAGLAVGFAVNGVQRAAEEGVARATAAALRAADMEPAAIEAALNEITGEVRALRTVLAERPEDPEAAAALDRAAARLAEIRDALSALREPTVRIDPATLSALAAVVDDALDRLLGAGPAPPPAAEE